MDEEIDYYFRIWKRIRNRRRGFIGSRKDNALTNRNRSYTKFRTIRIN